MSQGPLSGVRIVEFAGIGPGPFCCMLLADLGADVIRIDRKHGHQAHFTETRFDVASRGKRSIAMDLKKPEAVATCLKLIEQADAIVEGFRPGVMERLGLGPDTALAHNPRLVYARMTGWGQEGSIAHSAGHDINYIALSGALAGIGPKEKPIPPINLVGDYGGGALYLAFGLLAGLVHARESGRGQVVDCAISDGAASLMAVCYGLYASGVWNLERNANSLDGAAPNYDTYQCADGKWISIASTGAPFYRQLREIAGFDDPEFDYQKDRNHWASLKTKVAEKFKTKTQQEWCALMEGTDVCFAPVLDMSEAPAHHHNKSRNTFIDIDGVTQPAPTPRYSATPGAVRSPPPEIGQHTESALSDWGIDGAEVAELEAAGAI